MSHSYTALKHFGRSLRDEPAFGVYPHRIWVEKNNVLASEVEAWAAKRYSETKKGYLYRIVTYKHTDGNRYVDFIWLQTCKDTDLIYFKMRWGCSEYKIQRGERVARRKLTKEQRTMRDQILAEAEAKFYASLG
jgi:hypothetical protein